MPARSPSPNAACSEADPPRSARDRKTHLACSLPGTSGNIRGFPQSESLEHHMARVCQVTGKAPMVGNNVSHANNKTKRRFLPNLQYRRFWSEAENRWIRLRVSNAGLRTIDKKGIDAVVAELRARGEI